MIYFYRKTVIVWMLACIFGCIAINAQPSLKEQKVKVEKWDRKLKVMQSQYSTNRLSLGRKTTQVSNDDLEQWRALYKEAADDRLLAKMEWHRLRNMYRETTDSLKKAELKPMVHAWLKTFQIFDGRCRRALNYIARLDVDRILTQNEQTLQIAKLQLEKEKAMKGNKPETIRRAVLKIKSDYISDLYKQLDTLSESEKDLQRDSIALISKALEYYKKATRRIFHNCSNLMTKNLALYPEVFYLHKMMDSANNILHYNYFLVNPANIMQTPHIHRQIINVIIEKIKVLFFLFYFLL